MEKLKFQILKHFFPVWSVERRKSFVLTCKSKVQYRRNRMKRSDIKRKSSNKNRLTHVDSVSNDGCFPKWVTICNNQKVSSNRSHERFLTMGNEIWIVWFLFSFSFEHVNIKTNEIDPFVHWNANDWWTKTEQNKEKRIRRKPHISWCRTIVNLFDMKWNYHGKLTWFEIKTRKKHLRNQK